MALTTNALLKRIIKGEEFGTVLDKNESSFEERSLPEYLKELCESKGVVAEQVIKKSQIDRTYGHQIFNGTRSPSRDKLLQLAFGFGLDLNETQKLLRVAGKSTLYPKIKRDAACIFGLTHEMDIMEVNYLLASVDLPILGEV